MIDYKRDSKPPYPSYKTLARHMGISDKMVREYAKRLGKKGYLRRVIQIAKPNLFDLTPLFAALENLVKQGKVKGPRR